MEDEGYAPIRKSTANKRAVSGPQVEIQHASRQVRMISRSLRSVLVARLEASSSLSASVMPSACAREKPRCSSFLITLLVSTTKLCIDCQSTTRRCLRKETAAGSLARRSLTSKQRNGALLWLKHWKPCAEGRACTANALTERGTASAMRRFSISTTTNEDGHD